ncbi:MAG TPA: serine/threonine-protein kinase [Thermoanaerobaculia bacterium]|nr:serine/threonine-protein kinase [Thermoanaerobaculia bacterium]
MKPGDILDGRYEILARLGAGGMGEVYKATHTLLGSQRVIKVVHPHISGNTDAKDRFLREARAATKIQHSNVATLHDFAALPDGAHYMVWEFIDGENLAQRLRTRGTLPPRQAVRIGIQALRGLEAIHRAGIIHRDISPENLMITRDDEVKIIDLGVAKVEDTDAVSQTRTGIFVGKLRYASPEQLGFLPEGERVDGRADLYAISMVMVELLTGRPPYEATSPHEYFMIHAQEPRKKTVELPKELPGSGPLQEILEKALSRDRKQRYASARDFAAALEEIERTLPEPASPPTVMTPYDGDATLKVASNAGTAVRGDTLNRPTVRTDAPAAAIPAAATVRTPMPMQPPPVPTVAATVAATVSAQGPSPVKLRRGINPAYAVGFVAVLLLIAGGLAFWPWAKEREPLVQYGATDTSTPTSTQVAVTTTTAPATVAPAPVPDSLQASVTVTSGTEPPILTDTTATELSAPIPAKPIVTNTIPSTATVAPPRPRPRPVKPVVPEPEREAPVDNSPVPTYVDGGDDSDANERAMARLRRELRGVNTVALRAPGMYRELYQAMRDQFPNLVFEGEAPVVIRFNGTSERLGRGRKRRGATATVEKNGRVIFRYELPNEVYREGTDSAGAFVNVLGNAIR